MHSDDTARFRNITLIYLERQVESLRQLKEQLDENPQDQELRMKWVDTVKDFGERASHLAREWMDRYPDRAEDGLGETQPVARIQLETSTPS